MSDRESDLLTRYPVLRRFLSTGFRHVPEHDAPTYGLLCIESANQRLFVEPETGYFHVGFTCR